MKQVDNSNIAEFLYEIGGSRMTNAGWFKCMWWDTSL